MSLPQLTRESVILAVEEYDALGQSAFLRTYGFSPAREYFLLLNGRRYDSKAIAGAAHKYAVPSQGALRPADFSGGDATVARVMEHLGFEVQRRPASAPSAVPRLDAGRVYTWDDLGTAFGFQPSLFQVGGGMLSRPEHNTLLLITHPGGARSFDYEDRWDGTELIYTGRGKTGDQRLEGPNRDVAENRKRLLVLEAVGSRQLRHIGEAVCVGAWKARSTDTHGQPRDVWKFRLAFNERPSPAEPSISELDRERRTVLRTPRPFSAPDLSGRRRPISNRSHVTAEEIAALQEKANANHSRMLQALSDWLRAKGWTQVEEIPGSVDLWGTAPEGAGRVLFEAKTLSETNEIHQCRAALSQLLEYRFFYGTALDRLCVVLNAPISDRRRAFLEEISVAILMLDGAGSFVLVGRLAELLFNQPTLTTGATLA